MHGYKSRVTSFIKEVSKIVIRVSKFREAFVKSDGLLMSETLIFCSLLDDYQAD